MAADAKPEITTLEVAEGLGDAPDKQAVLAWSELVRSTLLMFRLSGRVVFRRKILFMATGILAYYGILYAVAVYEPNEMAGLDVQGALFMFVELPGVVLAIYLTMDLVAKERDRNTLETLFSTGSSHYVVWSVRMISVYLVLLITLMIMSTTAYFFFAEFPFVWGGLNAFIPTFLMASVTFYCAVFTRSSNAAGMLSLGFLIFVLMTYESLQGTNYDLFLKPFNATIAGDDPVWAEKMLINRSAVFGAGLLLLFLGLRRMERREKLLN